MKNLLIGNTSQISNFFPDDFEKVSSYNIDFDFLQKTKYKNVFLCFGQSKKFLENKSDYENINFNLTLECIDKLKNNSSKIFFYSTCELWNNYSGGINIESQFNFQNTFYTNSKYKISNHILSRKEEYKNVFVLYPFNFNSIFRSKDFLFGKIFSSIINKEIIEIGDTYFYRDIIHPKFVVEESLNAFENKIIGSGRLTFVNDFIRDLFKYFRMDYNFYIKESLLKFKERPIEKEFYLKSKENLYNYDQLLSDTILEIENYINKKNKKNYNDEHIRRKYN